MRKTLLIMGLLTLLIQGSAFTQNIETDSIDTTIKFSGDFRFRAEYDWHSRKEDGSYRTNRSRLRYRFRFGLSKNINQHFSVSAGIRTGNLNDQQGPHVTLGSTSEFGLVQLGFEKMFLQYKHKHFWAWVGKNQFPFWTQHELLWNDNVLPEGMAMGYKFKHKNNITIAPTFGYFIINTYGNILKRDNHITSLQLKSTIKINKYQSLLLNIGSIYFNEIPNIPDGKETGYLNYNILTTSFCYKIKTNKLPLSIGMDWYVNSKNYIENQENRNPSLLQEKQGLVFNIKYGQLKKRGDITFHAYFASIGKYAVVDYFAQNDWARWDYSNYGATGSRLSNFKGIEFRSAYNIANNINITARFYMVEQLVPTDSFKESGNRFRIDLNAKF